MTTKEEIRGWLQQGKKEKATHLIVVCDTFDHSDYPVFVQKDQNVHNEYARYNEMQMQRVMEVYAIDEEWEEQLRQRPCLNFSPPLKLASNATTDSVAESFFLQIKAVMKASKVTQSDLARKLGCSRAYVSQMFDQSNLTVGTMSKIVDALGVELTFSVNPKTKVLLLKKTRTTSEEHGMAQTSAYVVLQRGPAKLKEVCKDTGLVEIRAKKALEDLVKRKLVRKSGGIYYRIEI